MDVLETLLLAAVRECWGEQVDFVGVTRDVLSCVLDQRELFEALPERMAVEVIPIEQCGLDSPRTRSMEEFHSSKAVLLFDGLTAAAGGRRSYIYKSKGFRVYLFESGEVCTLTPYCKIDDRGFSLGNELWDIPCDFHVHMLRTAEPVADLFEMISEKKPAFLPDARIGLGLIKMITSLRSRFPIDYCLEYVIVPPDVDILSGFSQGTRRDLWDVCLSRRFEREAGHEVQTRAIALLMEAGISPQPDQILDYLQRIGRSSSCEDLLQRMDELKLAVLGRIDQLADDLSDPDFWQRLGSEQRRTHSAVVRQFQNAPCVRTMNDVVHEILEVFKTQIEAHGLWKELWDRDKPKPESSVQNLFFSSAISFCRAYGLDISPESDGGSGPVDFKISAGWHDKVVVEFKLSTNTSVVHGYECQLERYKDSENTEHGIFVLVDVGELGGKLERVRSLQSAKGERASDIVYVDARPRVSASKKR
ncbi:hypothetical protein EON09_20265 [Pseudomonas soli]|jgi:hypothetical protein|nr:MULTISPECIES: hypothetical protein [Pseudomonas]MEE1882789.1 hypothetical protein [Pseudomonas soli]NBK40856.1 hypothetical protein [Pseudomonas soli]WJO24184.1 hypothetical protein LU688_11635 [Pseudomonas soli]SEQ13114.1 hypothetical protein SAMN05216230_10216 [Pseudomonas soli]